MKALRDKLRYIPALTVPARYWRATAQYRIEVGRRLSNPHKRNSSVFLIGCGRSGTNMLLSGLGKSYKVELYNESNPAAFTKWRLKSFTTIQQLTTAGYAQIKLYKPILDTHMAREFLVRFPRAKVIFIYRHYSDVITSSVRRFGADNWPSRVSGWMEDDFAEFNSVPPPEKTKKIIRSMWNNHLSAESSIALYWLFYNRLFFDLGLNQDANVFLVNYENLVTKPDAEFRNLCRFLSIRYLPRIAEGIFASSVKHVEVPNLDKTIQHECDELWDSLCNNVN